jgi:CubicO group peptidase (beta-lactamase class C family)
VKSVVLIGLLLVVGAGALGQSSGASDTSLGQPDLRPLLERVRARYALPSLGAVLVRGNQVISSAVVGERAAGSGVTVTLADQYQLSSLSKSFTATVMARLVEQGRLRWDTTLAEVFLDVPMLDAYKAVTLEMLLSHTAGLPANVENETVYDWAFEPATARAQYLRLALQLEPEFPPGRTVAYSNIGYVIASLVAERFTNQPWDALVRQFILGPLGMSCGFGVIFAPMTNPHPHRLLFGRALPLLPEAGNGNSPVLNGADNLRCSIVDLGVYLGAHLGGELGQDGIVKSASMKFLHRARQNAGQDIRAALGWFVFPDASIWHNGSNTLNHAEMMLVPNRNLAVGVVINAAGDATVTEASSQVMEALLDLVR